MADVYAAIPKGLRLLGEAVTEVSDLAAQLNKNVTRIRTQMQKQDRTEDILARIEKIQTSLVEAKAALLKIVQSTND
jgi:hypothetical protein